MRDIVMSLDWRLRRDDVQERKDTANAQRGVFVHGCSLYMKNDRGISRR